MKKLWVDDLRQPPNDTWVWAKTYQEAIDKISTGKFDLVSLDHDLGDFAPSGRERTGYDVLMYIVEALMTKDIRLIDKVNVHSANPPAHEKMAKTIEHYGLN